MSSKNVQILHSAQGRVRLHLAKLKHDHKESKAVHRRLCSIKGIDSVEINPQTGNVKIDYDADQNDFLAFQLSLAQALDMSPLDFDREELEKIFNGNGMPSADTQSERPEEPSNLPAVLASVMQLTHIVHSISGRVRLRMPALQEHPQMIDPLKAFLRDLDGISDVSINSWCSSVTIYYDSPAWSGNRVCQFLQQQNHEDIVGYHGPNVEVLPPPSPADEPAGNELWYSTVGLAIGILAEPLAAPVLPVILLASAWPMLKRTYHSLTVDKKLNVDVLDASAASLLVVQGNLPMAMFMIFLINIADYIRDLTMMQSKKAIEEVLAYQTNEAWVIRNGRKVKVPVSEVQLGELVVVYPGERITIDGVVQSGMALVDQATLTGESLPVEKNSGDPVYAATVVREGEITVQAESIGNETEAARIVRLVEDAPARETKIQNYAVKWANDIVPYSFMLGGVGAMAGGGLQGAAAVLIIDYGTGIRIAAPTTVLSSMTKSIRKGILIKGGRHLENLSEVNAIVFDKTGTLTCGHPDVIDVIPLNGSTPDQVLTLAAAAENRLTHPVAQAIVRAATDRGLEIPERTTSDYTIGLGVESCVNDIPVLVGNRRFMKQKQLSLSPAIQNKIREMEGRAVSPLCVAARGKMIGLLSYADPLRPEAKEVIQAIRDRGIKEIVMLTGDHENVAKRVAEELRITRYVSESFPGQKAEVVQELQQKGYKVAVVGDGINDSPALAYADVGIAVDGGTHVAQETAHVVLLHGGLWKIPAAIDIGREAVRLIHQSWNIIMIPNTIALGLAAVGLLGPIGATLLSNGSNILATANGLRPLIGATATEGPKQLPKPKIQEVPEVLELENPQDVKAAVA
jgi:Cu2+-exporting ATPase